MRLYTAASLFLSLLLYVSTVFCVGDEILKAFYIYHPETKSALTIKGGVPSTGASLVPKPVEKVYPVHQLFYKDDSGLIYSLAPGKKFVISPCGKDPSTKFVGLFPAEPRNKKRQVWKVEDGKVLNPWANNGCITHKGPGTRVELTPTSKTTGCPTVQVPSPADTEWVIKYYVEDLFVIAGLLDPINEKVLVGPSCRNDDNVYVKPWGLKLENMFFTLSDSENIIMSAENGKVLSQKNQDPNVAVSPLVMTPYDPNTSLAWIIEPDEARFEQLGRVITQPTSGTIGQIAECQRFLNMDNQRFLKIPVPQATDKNIKALRDYLKQNIRDEVCEMVKQKKCTCKPPLREIVEEFTEESVSCDDSYPLVSVTDGTTPIVSCKNDVVVIDPNYTTSGPRSAAA